MSTKTNVLVDKILKGVTINKNNEIDYSATIVITLEKDVDFEYAIVDEGSEERSFIPFEHAKKFTVINYKNTDGILRRKTLILKSEEKSDAEISIDLEKLLTTNNPLETVGARGTVLLNSTAGNNGEKPVWYKNPMVLAGIGILVFVILAIMFSKKKSPTGSTSIFVD